MAQNNLEWTSETKTSICETVVFTVFKEKCRSPQGDTGNYIVLDAPEWVICIPVLETNNKKQFLMVKQWRHGIKKVSIEFPGGVMEKDETPEQGAARELLEETGFKASKMVHLGTLSPNPAIMSNHVHFFAALDLIDTKEQHLDKDEYVDVLIQDQETVFSKMGSEDYPHALMSAAVALFQKKFY